jgi:uncharacterized membrane protein
MSKKINDSFAKFKRLTYFYLIFGFFLATIGLFKFLYITPELGINLKTMQPVLINGLLIFIIGLGLFCLGIYRIINQKMAFENEQKIKQK